MANVDNRIVQMQFDNTQFERKMSTTLQSLDKLNTTIANTGSKNGMGNLANSIKGFSLGPISTAIEGINTKFLAMSTIAITALSNIVTKAISAGSSILNSLSLGPVMSGFQEYELNMSSIQTILANTERQGTTLEDVTRNLDELNEYADQTIYNFGDMVKNIGLFTNAGIGIDQATSMIQGFSNAAAASGTSADGAAHAAYQLSQAMSTGTIRLMDWKSLQNVGMGNKNMQQDLISLAESMGTFEAAGISAEDATKNFNGSLESGWLSADVMSNYLTIMAGDMTDAEMAALGLSQAQIDAFKATQATAEEAATKIRTFTQLMSTVKESIGSGWSESFKLIFGDFEEATELFSGLGDVIGGFVKRSAESRNELLTTWRDMGGREAAIQGIKNAFKALSRILGPISKGFRDVFPKMTGERLTELSEKFRDFMGRLIPLGSTMTKIQDISRGFFNALKIGWTIIKEGVKFVADLVKTLFGMSGITGGGVLEYLSNLGDIVTGLKEKLVDEGGIAAFFDKLSNAIKNPMDAIKTLRDAFLGLFDNFGGASLSGAGEAATGFLDKIMSKFTGLNRVTSRLGDIFGPIVDGARRVGDALERVWDVIKDWFSSLGEKLAAAMKPGDFDAALDAVNVGLIGGIAALLYKLVTGGLKFDFGGGILDGITGALDQLTGTLSAMQANVKADTLLKIASAIGILTASVLVLSLIDSEALSKALIAMSIGFGQLMGAFAILNKLSLNLASAGTMAIVAGSMILLAGAVLVLTISIKLLSTMSWGELAKGLAGVAGALLILSGAAFIISKASGNLLSAGIGMMGMAVAMIIMAGAVKLFSMMKWDEMAQGLVGVAGALLAVGLAMKIMPAGQMILQGAGLILVAGSLLVLAGAVKLFSMMSWEDIGKGLAAIAGSLLIIGAAAKLVGPNLLLMGPGLLMVAFALGPIADAVAQFGGMSWGEIAKGLVGLAGALLAISLAMTAAQGSLLGAAGLLVASYALDAIAEAVQQFAGMSWGDLAKGFAAIAVGMTAIGIAGALVMIGVPGLLGLGAALLLIGGAIALFGVGIASIGKGFQLMAEFGESAAESISAALEVIADAIPKFLSGVAKGILGMVQTLLDGIGPIIKSLGVVLGHIIDTLIELVPKAGELIRALMTEILETIREVIPDLITTGNEVLLAFLTGIRDNIGEIVTVVADIITNFIDALALKIPEMIDSVYNFILAVIEGVALKFVDIGQELAPRALELIQGFVQGLQDALPEIGTFFTELPGIIGGFLVNAGTWLLTNGTELISGLLSGASSFFTETVLPWLAGLPALAAGAILDALTALAGIGTDLLSGLKSGAETGWETAKTWFSGLPQLIRTAIGGLLELLRDIGGNVIAGLKNGAEATWGRLRGWFTQQGQRVRSAVGTLFTTLKDIGGNLMSGLYNGALAGWGSVRTWFTNQGQRVRSAVGTLLTTLKDIGGNVIRGFYNAALNQWEEVRSFFDIGQKIRNIMGSLRSLLSDIGGNIIEGLISGAKAAWEAGKGFFGDIGGFIRGLKGPPEKDKVLLVDIGHLIINGLMKGVKDEWQVSEKWFSSIDIPGAFDKNLTTKMTEVVSGIANSLNGIEEFQPKIRPVLDLTQIQSDAKALAGMMPNASYLAASQIARSSAPGQTTTTPTNSLAGNGEVKFEQNIYAPKQLSTGDIYRQTRNQITMAKEELSIP